MSELRVVTEPLVNMIADRLRREGVAFHYCKSSLSRRDAFREMGRLSTSLEEVLDVPVFFDRLTGNDFELWVETR